MASFKLSKAMIRPLTAVERRKIAAYIKAHDEENTAAVGDRVSVVETRPLSADKRWKIEKVLEKAKGVIEIANPAV